MTTLSKIVERFEAHVTRNIDGHWIWTGATSHGYGALALGPKQAGNIQAHVFAYELYVGPVPYGLVVDHCCRVPLCVRPDHLEPVPQAVNCRRGRKARLTMDDAEEIRSLFASGMTQPVIAQRYNTSAQYVSMIIRGLRWAPTPKPFQRSQHVNPFIAKHLRGQLTHVV